MLFFFQASFAQFDVKISNAFPYDNFLVSPDSGVGSALVSLTIKNPSLLNYEILADRQQTVTVSLYRISQASAIMVTVQSGTYR